MAGDPETDPAHGIELCRAAHSRLAGALRRLNDVDARAPSRLPHWSVGHVLTHVARNADGHARRLEGALAGRDVPRYPGGGDQRNREIDEGATRPVSELVADVTSTSDRLESVWDECMSAGWPHADLRGSDSWPITSSPVRRLREVEFHHVDLGLGYEVEQWDDDYVRWELAQVLAGVPGRLASADQARAIILWLTRSGPAPERVDLDPW